MEPDCNVIKLGPQTFQVPEFYGLSNVLDGNVMSFHYEHRPNIQCTIRVMTPESGLPGHGQLVTGEPDKLEGPRGDEPDSFVSIRQQLGMIPSNVSYAPDIPDMLLNLVHILFTIFMNVLCHFLNIFKLSSENKARAKCRSENCLKGLKLVTITKVPCEEFLMMGIRYQHTDPPSPDIDYIAIKLDLTDTRSGSIIQVHMTKAWTSV